MPRRTVLERDVKREITKYLDALPVLGVPCYYRMHVPFGYGRSGLDYEGCIAGLFFAIEAKSPDDAADMTPLQRETALDILAGGGKVFVISGPDGLGAFYDWVDRCCRH